MKNESISNNIIALSTLLPAIPGIEEKMLGGVTALKKSDQHLSSIETSKKIKVECLLDAWPIRKQQQDIISYILRNIHDIECDNETNATMAYNTRFANLFFNEITEYCSRHRANGLKGMLIPLLIPDNFSLFTKEEQETIILALEDSIKTGNRLFTGKNIPEDQKILQKLKEYTSSANSNTSKEERLKKLFNEAFNKEPHNGVFHRLGTIIELDEKRLENKEQSKIYSQSTINNTSIDIEAFKELAKDTTEELKAFTEAVNGLNELTLSPNKN